MPSCQLCCTGLSALLFCWSRAFVHLLSPASNCYKVLTSPLKTKLPALPGPESSVVSQSLNVPAISLYLTFYKQSWQIQMLLSLTYMQKSLPLQPTATTLGQASFLYPPHYCIIVLVLPLPPYFGLFNKAGIQLSSSLSYDSY